MSSINTSDVISVLKEEISDFDVKMTAVDEGSIISMGDGIVTVYGLSNAMYGELVIFETGVKGMVQGLEEQTVSFVRRRNFLSSVIFSRGERISWEIIVPIPSDSPPILQ